MNELLKLPTKLIEVNFLAKRNNLFCRYLNKIINGCQINAFIPKSVTLVHNGFGIVIGSNVKIGENVKIYHNVTIGNKYPYDNQYTPREKLVIENNVIINTNSIILGTIKIGKNSIIGAGTFIDKDIPPESIVYNKKELIIKKRKK